MPRGQSDAVAAQLRQREAAHAGIGRLLARALAARAAHRLDGATMRRLPLYQRVLALQPDRVEALEGREDALSDLLQQARAALQEDDIGTARAPGRRCARIRRRARRPARCRSTPGVRDRPGTTTGRTGHASRPRSTRPPRAIACCCRWIRRMRSRQRGVERLAQAWSHRAARLAADFRFDDAGAALANAQDAGARFPRRCVMPSAPSRMHARRRHACTLRCRVHCATAVCARCWRRPRWHRHAATC